MEKMKQIIKLLECFEKDIVSIMYWINSKILNLNNTEKGYLLNHFNLLNN